MAITYTPEQTAAWTPADWDRLAGKTVTVTTGDGISETRSVRAAQLNPGPYGPDAVVHIEWADCGGLTFVREPGATVTIHDVETS
jgi:hypothetical protein